MNNENKFPQTWYLALSMLEQDFGYWEYNSHIEGPVFRYSQRQVPQSKQRCKHFESAAKLMAERYEKRIEELENGLKTIKELGQYPNDYNCLLAAQIANNLIG